MSVVAMIVIAITILISVFCAIVILFLVSAITTVEPYFRQWLNRKLDKALEPKNCDSCKYHFTDYDRLPPRHYCNMVGKNITEDSSCDRWERR